ncbi:hypothetical protein WKW80_04705 [Variovorax humicola]|uniref:CHAP domain-containing protein n=1 Tax=Variovorax humicola TaxID=1769758 RepID=A0ABU8VUC4_9BURK
MRPVLIAALWLCAAAAVHAEEAFDFNRDCAKWIEQHGYSLDYIVLKTGKRQRGQPKAWRGNVEPRDVQPGDVVIMYIQDRGNSERVAYVEEVRRNADGTAGAVFVTEWNRGKYIDRACFVTDHFGRLSESKPVTVDTIDKVWRPSLPLKGAAAE